MFCIYLLIFLNIFYNVACKLPTHKFPTVVLSLRRMRNIRVNKYCACVCLRLVMTRHRLEAVYIRRFVCIIRPFNLIFFTAVGVVGYGRALDKYKMQVGCRSDITKIIGINIIAGCIRGFQPFTRFLLFGQAARVINYISRQFQKFGYGISVFIMLCVIHTYKFTAVINICLLHNGLNFKGLTVGNKG